MTQRFVRRRRSKVRLTQWDLAILRAVFEARYVTNRQVCRLLLTPSTFSWCKQRLGDLYGLRYLSSGRPMSTGRTSTGCGPQETGLCG